MIFSVAIDNKVIRDVSRQNCSTFFCRLERSSNDQACKFPKKNIYLDISTMLQTPNELIDEYIDVPIRDPRHPVNIEKGPDIFVGQLKHI